MPEDRTIDYIELPGGDFDTLEAFYSTAFGWRFTDYGANYRAFTDGKLDGGFYRSSAVSSTATGAALVVLYAADLASTQARIIACQGRICRAIFSFPGGRRLHFNDPHGNELAIWSANP